MVGVINPANGTSIDIQKQAAISAPFQLVPGEAWPAEGTTIGSETVPASASPSMSPAKVKHHLSGGAIAGIAIALIIFVGTAAALFYFIGRWRARKEVTRYINVESRSNAIPRTISPPINTVPQRSAPSPQPISELWSPISPVSMDRYLPLSEKTPLSPPARHPAFGPFSEQSTTYELDGGRI
jgi:hypothetical protein